MKKNKKQKSKQLQKTNKNIQKKRKPPVKTQKKKRKTAIKPDFLSSEEKKRQKNINRIAAAVIFVLTFILYANTISYEYVLDDKAVITNNQYTKKGISGIGEILGADIFTGIKASKKDYVAGGRYRPLSLVTFAIEWELSADYEITDASMAQMAQNNVPKAALEKIKKLKGERHSDKEVIKKKIMQIAGNEIPPSKRQFVYGAIEFEGRNPALSHIINILMYAFTGILIFIILNRLFSYISKERLTPRGFNSKFPWYLSVPFITTLIYMVHPLHTEVITNIKGRDEIMVFMFSMITLWFVIRYYESLKIYHLLAAFATFFLAFLSKENAVTYVALIPLTIYFFLPERPVKQNTRVYTAIFSVLVLATILFLIQRYRVIGSFTTEPTQDLMNDPFLYTTFGERYATIFYTLGLYLKLLFYPHPLTFDYYPYHIPIINWLDFRAIIPLLIYLALGAYSVWGLIKKDIIAYGIWFYLITFSIVSNIVFPIGAFLSERFMYISSLGFCLVIAYLLVYKIPDFINQKTKFSLSRNKYMTAVSVFIVLFALAFSLKTIIRNTAWKDEYTLFTTDVKTSPLGAKSNYAAGFAYIEKAKKVEDEAEKMKLFEKGISYLNNALIVHPKYENVLLYMANVYYEIPKDYEKSIENYLKVLELFPTYNKAYNYILWILKNHPKPIPLEYRINTYIQLYRINPNRIEVCFNLGVLYFKEKKEVNKSLKYLQRAAKLNPKNPDVQKLLGVVYGRINRFDKAVTHFEQAALLNPKDANVFKNLAITYQQLGNTEKAQINMQRYNILRQKK